MNNIAKVLIGVGVVGAIAATTYIVAKKNEKPKDIADQAIENQHKDDTIIEKIKTAALKKAIKILTWVTLNKDKVEAFAVILSVVGAMFQIILSVRDFVAGRKMRKTIDKMFAHDMEFEDVWNAHMNQGSRRHEEILNMLNDIMENMPVKKSKSA